MSTHSPLFSNGTDGFSLMALLVALAGLAILFFGVVAPSLFLLTHSERKLTADLQARVGPNRTGWSGMSQAIADLIKLLQKRDLNGGFRFSWRSVQTVSLFSTLAVLPVGSGLLFVDPDMGSFLPIFSLGVFALAVVFQSLEKSRARGGIGGVRIAAQFVTGLVPALLALLAAGLRAGSFRWTEIVGSQSSHPFAWAIWTDPFQLLAFLVFVASGLVLLGVPPLHSAYSEVELNGGFSSTISGAELGLFRLSRLFAIFFWSVFATALFLGGWGGLSGLESGVRLALEVVWVLAKSGGLLFGVLLIGRTVPRVRSDQVTEFAWKVLCPLAVISLVGTALWTLGKDLL